MATALKDPTLEALSAIAAQIDPRQNEHEPIPDTYDGPAPQQVIVRDVGMRAQNGILDFFYSIPRKRGPVPVGGIEEVIAELLYEREPRASDQADFARGAAGDNAGNGNGTGSSELAAGEEKPLDLNVDQPSYVVFRLSADWRWAFDPRQAGITTKLAAEAHGHGGLRHVGVNGDGTYGHFRQPHDNCRIVYFIANPPAGVYFHGFNLEVELQQSAGPLGIERVLPISIDPDVRNPGGSEG